MIKPLIILSVVILLAILAYDYFTDSEPVLLDTTISRYENALKLSKTCVDPKKPAPKTCEQVIVKTSEIIEKMRSTPSNKNKYSKELLRLYRALEKSQVKINDFQSAIKTTKKIIELEPQGAHHYSRLSRHYLKINANKEAIRYAVLTAQLSPFIWRSFVALGNAYEQDEQFKKADEAYQKAIELAPSHETHQLENKRQLIMTNLALSAPLLD